MSAKPTISVSVSEGQAFKHCQQLHDYRFRRNLQPRLTKRPLKLGSWSHYCLQHHYDKSGWQGALKELMEKEWEALFDEERAYYGDLPGQTAQIMQLYSFYYREDPWELVLPPEVPIDFTIETKNYFIRFLGKIDLVVRDSRGNVWCIDHKTGRSIPTPEEPKNFQAMDTQLTFYPWVLEKQYGIESFGTMYNYIRTKVGTVPHLNKDGTLSKAKIDTDVLTFLRACKEYGINPEDYPDQYDTAKEKTPTYFYRLRVPRDRVAMQSAVTDLVNTAIAKDHYATPTRNVTYLCRQCEMQELCMAEFFKENVSAALGNYTVGSSPYAYLGILEEVN